jgi:hypothetical protein
LRRDRGKMTNYDRAGLAPWHYDAAARHALQSASLRRSVIVRYNS